MSLPVADKPESARPFNEMGASAECRAHYALVRRWLDETPPELLTLKRREAELLFRRIGITFAVYTEGGDPERLIPFDIIPRVLDAGEWALISMDSTLRSNLTVGPPVDLLVYRRDSLKIELKRRITEEDEYFRMIRERWSEALREAYLAIPRPDWRE